MTGLTSELAEHLGELRFEIARQRYLERN